MSSTLERLGPGDWREFSDIRLRALADAPDSFGMTLVDVQRNSEADWRNRLSGRDPIIAIRGSGALVAMGAGWLPPEEANRMMVWGMWTSPEARGHGHARSLLSYLLEWAIQRDVTTVELHVAEGNDIARRLYLDCGFAATGEWEPLRQGSELQIELLRWHRSSTPRG